MIQEKIKLQKIAFSTHMPIHSKPVQYLPSDSVPRFKAPKNGNPGLELVFDPELECIEVKTPGWPTLLIPRDALMYMEVEQECKVGRTGPFVEPSRPAPAVVEAPGSTEPTCAPSEAEIEAAARELTNPTGPEILPDSPKQHGPPCKALPVEYKPDSEAQAVKPDLRPPPMGEVAKPADKFSKIGKRKSKTSKRKPGRPRKK